MTGRKAIKDRLCGNIIRGECAENEAAERRQQDQLWQERSPMWPAGMVDYPVLRALAVQRRHHLRVRQRRALDKPAGSVFPNGDESLWIVGVEVVEEEYR
jgi:hypothetical protein